MRQKKGLNDDEVLTSRGEHGANVIRQQITKSFKERWLATFKDPMLAILLVALVLSIIVDFIHLLTGQTVDIVDIVGITTAILTASLLSTIFEHRNEQAFNLLKEESAQMNIKLYRNNQLVILPTKELVVGDVVLLQSGDKIPADGFLLEGNLTLDQSILNGESQESHKTAAPTPPKGMFRNLFHENFLFSGSTVLDGIGQMQILAVGEKSLYGELTRELQIDTMPDTPLKVKTLKLARYISYLAYVGGLTITLLYFVRLSLEVAPLAQLTRVYLQDLPLLMENLLESLMIAIILVVVTIPEGVPLMIAIVSAMMMRRMLKDEVLVRNQTAIETAGSINILFTDKTGTITYGNFQVIQLWYQAKLSHDLPHDLLPFILQSSHTQLGKESLIGGNTTDKALYEWALEHHEEATRHFKSYPVIKTIPFNSQKKWSATIIEELDGRHASLIKGAPEMVLAKSTHYYGENDAILPIDSTLRRELQKQMLDWSDAAMRILALAHSYEPLVSQDNLTDNLILVGLVAVRDEIRPEAIIALKEVNDAGIQVVMISGDKRETAHAIAKESGIFKPNGVALDSAELALMSDEQVIRLLPKIQLISRALPSDKSRLVRIAQSQGLVVGMTGDGVNDAPALKSADVGFAMGSGSEVAKEASDMIILDDNFSSIRKAVLYGRTIYKNIQKFIVFQLTINFSALFITLLFPLLGFPPPLSISQMLWINLIIDTLAALAFGSEPILREYMKDKPKKRDEPILHPMMLEQIVVMTVTMVALSFYFLYNDYMQLIFRHTTREVNAWSSAFFAFFVLGTVLNAFNVRTTHITPFSHISKNYSFALFMLFIVVLQYFLTTYGGAIMQSYGLTLGGWLIVIRVSLVVFAIGFFHKLVRVRS